MALVRSVPRANDNLKNGKWVREMGVEVKGKTLGIIGLGKGIHHTYLFRTMVSFRTELSHVALNEKLS